MLTVSHNVKPGFPFPVPLPLPDKAAGKTVATAPPSSVTRKKSRLFISLIVLD